jgi:hypothetical protein
MFIYQFTDPNTGVGYLCAGLNTGQESERHMGTQVVQFAAANK